MVPLVTQNLCTNKTLDHEKSVNGEERGFKII